MPLVNIFVRSVLAKPVPLSALQSKMCAIWGTTPSTTKLMLSHVADWTGDTFEEDCYVSVRAKATPERTREVVVESMKEIQRAFADHDLIANIRLETYEGQAYFHVPPCTKEAG